DRHADEVVRVDAEAVVGPHRRLPGHPPERRQPDDTSRSAQPTGRDRIRSLGVFERAGVDSHDSEAPEQGRRTPVRAARPRQARVRMEPSAPGSGVAMASASGPLADVAAYRRFFAEEIEACAGLRTPRLVEAFATIPREQFLGSGPWITRSEADVGGPSRQTPDADPRRVYHNVVLAIDPARQLFNGQPSTLGTWIDALEIRPGACVLHVGAGSGYYSAILAHIAGPAGRVVAIEVDEALAALARRNLEPYGWVDVRHGDATTSLGESFDAILLNAGATHPRDEWLDA